METKKEKLSTKKRIKRFLMINVGVILMAIAYAIFVDPHGLIIGGTSGLGTLFSGFKAFDFIKITLFGETFGSSQIFMLAFNMVLLLFALIFVNKEFFFNSIYVSIAYPIFSIAFAFLYEKFLKNSFIDVAMIEEIAKSIAQIMLSHEKTIISMDSETLTNMIKNILQIGPYMLMIIFGSTISSIGIGLALKNGSSTGGVDILQKIFLDKFKIPFSVSLIMIDGTIVLLSAIYFRSIFVILYGVIFILISGVIIDMIVFNGFNSRAVNIITDEPEIIKQAVIERFDRTVTEVNATGAYSGKPKKMLVCVMGNSEFYQLKALIEEIDPKAFIYTTRANEVHGEGFSYGDAPKANKKWKKHLKDGKRDN